MVGVAMTTSAPNACSSSVGSASSAADRNDLARHEHHDELRRRVEAPPVGLGAQRVDVGADLPGVGGRALAPGRVVAGLGGLEVRRERDLRVDDDLLAACEVHHEVRAQRPLVVGAPRVGLPGEVAVLDHAGQVDDPLELQLAPPAAHVGRAQGGDQRAGLAGHPGRPAGHGAHLLAQRGERGLPLLLGGAHLRLHAPEGRRDRVEQGGQCVGARGVVGLGGGGQGAGDLADPGGGQRRELLGVAGQASAEAARTASRSAPSWRAERPLPLVRAAALDVELGARGGHLRPGPAHRVGHGRLAAGGGEPGGQHRPRRGAEREAQEQPEEQPVAATPSWRSLWRRPPTAPAHPASTGMSAVGVRHDASRSSRACLTSSPQR